MESLAATEQKLPKEKKSKHKKKHKSHKKKKHHSSSDCEESSQDVKRRRVISFSTVDSVALLRCGFRMGYSKLYIRNGVKQHHLVLNQYASRAIQRCRDYWAISMAVNTTRL